MYKITINFKGGSFTEAKATSNVISDKVAILPWVMYERFPDLLDPKEWAKSQETIFNRLDDVCSGCITSVYIKHVDGRKNGIKALEWFSWPKVFEAVRQYRFANIRQSIYDKAHQ